MAEVREMNVASMTEGSHQFIKPAAEFSKIADLYEGPSPAGLDGFKDF